MTPRLQNHFKLAPEGIKALLALEASFKAGGLEESLLNLIKLRASQINGCAFCIHMHTTEARAHGETEMRLYMLNAWRESSLYSERERAALAWTEALTKLTQAHPAEADYQALRAHFADKAIVDLTTLIGMINLWNRLAIGMHYVHDVDAKPHDKQDAA